MNDLSAQACGTCTGFIYSTKIPVRKHIQGKKFTRWRRKKIIIFLSCDEKKVERKKNVKKSIYEARVCLYKNRSRTWTKDCLNLTLKHVESLSKLSAVAINILL